MMKRTPWSSERNRCKTYNALQQHAPRPRSRVKTNTIFDSSARRSSCDPHVRNGCSNRVRLRDETRKSGSICFRLETVHIHTLSPDCVGLLCSSPGPSSDGQERQFKEIKCLEIAVCSTCAERHRGAHSHSSPAAMIALHRVLRRTAENA